MQTVPRLSSLSAPDNTLPSFSIKPRRFRAGLTTFECPPVVVNNYPALPVASRDGALSYGYSISTHILPAAYPRSASAVWEPLPLEEPVNDRKQRIKNTVQHISDRKEAQERGDYVGKPRGEILWTVANRYVKNDFAGATEGLTVVLLHGIGTHKEVSGII